MRKDGWYIIGAMLILLLMIATAIFASVARVQDSAIIPFSWENGRIFITTTADGTPHYTMWDTGSQDTMLDASQPHPPAYRYEELVDYRGQLQNVPVTNMRVCVAGFCGYEDVAIVSDLRQQMILRGAFFSDAQSLTINYKQQSIEIDGWQ